MEKITFRQRVLAPNYDFLSAEEKMMVILTRRGIAEKNDRSEKSFLKWLSIIGLVCILVVLKIKGA